MYAVIATGGKQYKVTEGQLLRLEKIEGEVGSNVTFDKILLLGDGDKIEVGKPFVKGTVEAEVVEQGRDKKISMIKFKRRKRQLKRIGHRQYFTELKITKIAG